MLSRDLLRPIEYTRRYGGDPTPCRITKIAVPGLVVHEEWLAWEKSPVLPVTLALVIGIIVGARFLFGDWQAGLAAGACFISFLTIPVLWVNHMVARV